MRIRLTLIILLAGFLPCFLGYCATRLVLAMGQEQRSLDVLLDTQFANGGIYNGLYHSPADYKLAAIAKLKPDIVVLGSSRAMRFHSEFFTVPAYSMGGLVYSPAEAVALMDLLRPIYRPSVVIYAMDYWAFCTVGDEPQPEVVPRPHPVVAWPHWPKTINQVSFVWTLLSKGYVQFQSLLELPWMPASSDGVSLHGLSAVINHVGFLSDGATTGILGKTFDHTPDFPDTVDLVRQGLNQWPHGCRLDRRAMRYLAMLADDMDARGIRLVLVAPPLPPAINVAMTAQGSFDLFLAEWRNALAATDREVHFFHYASDLGGDDREFPDGMHGGDVTYARLVRAMASRPGGGLEGLVAQKRLEHLIESQTGVATFPAAFWHGMSKSRRE